MNYIITLYYIKRFTDQCFDRDKDKALRILKGILDAKSTRISLIYQMPWKVIRMPTKRQESFCRYKYSENKFVIDKLSFDLFLNTPEYGQCASIPVFSSCDSARFYAKVLRDFNKK